MAMELSVHGLIKLVTKDLTSLLDFWKDRRYETDSAESFRHFMAYETDIKSFLSKVDAQLEFWKRLKSLDNGVEDSSRKNSMSSTSTASTIDSRCQTKTTTFVRNSKIGNTEDKAENSKSQQTMSENINGCDKVVEKHTTTVEQEIVNTEMTGNKIGERFVEICRSLQKKSIHSCQSVDKETATSTTESGLELHDKNDVCCISDIETVGTVSPVVSSLADTPSSTTTIDLTEEDVIIETKKEPEEMIDCQTGNFNPTPEINLVEDSGNGSSGEDDLTNSPPEEIRNPSDDLGESYIQQDNAELFINNLGIDGMVTIHDDSIKEEIPSEPEGPSCSTNAFPELPEIASIKTENAEGQHPGLPISSEPEGPRSSTNSIPELSEIVRIASIKAENPERLHSSQFPQFPELPSDMPAKRARICVELPENARTLKDRELDPEVILDESVRKIADKAIKYNQVIKIPPKDSRISIDLERVKSEKPKKKIGILTPAQNLKAKHYAISIERTVEKSRQFLLAAQLNKHSSKKRNKQRKKLKKKRFPGFGHYL